MSGNVEDKIYWGFSEKLPGGKASRIKVLGEKNSDIFIRYKDDLIKNIFTPKGKVFLPQPMDYFCSFKVEPNKNEREGPLDADDFIVSRGTIRQITFPMLIEINSINNSNKLPLEELKIILNNLQSPLENGQYYIRVLSENSLIGPFEKRNDGLFPKIGKEVPVYTINNDFMETYVYNSKYLLFMTPDHIGFESKSMIDCMSIEQLKEWFRQRINTLKIFNKEIEKSLNEVLKSPDIFSSDILDSSRFARVKEHFDDFNWSSNELRLLFSPDEDYSLQFSPNTIQQIKTEIQQEIEDKLQKENTILQEEKRNLEKEKTVLRKEIEDYQQKANKIKDSIKNLGDEYKSIQDNYDSLITQLKINAKISTIDHSDKPIMRHPSVYMVPQSNKSFEELQDDEYDMPQIIKRNLKRFDYNDSIIETFFEKDNALISSQSVLIPCVSWAYIYAQGIGNANVYTIHVEHDWLHYNDFFDNGLNFIWQGANKNPQINYILVLQDLNITQPECGCTPLLDLISGFRPFLEGTELGLLNNIKIFATIIPYEENNAVGLKISKSIFTNWATFGNPFDAKYKVNINNNNPELFCYLKPEDINTLYSLSGIIPGDEYFAD